MSGDDRVKGVAGRWRLSWKTALLVLSILLNLVLSALVVQQVIYYAYSPVMRPPRFDASIVAASVSPDGDCKLYAFMLYGKCTRAIRPPLGPAREA